MSKDKKSKLILHFDLNKTILFEDSLQNISKEGQVRPNPSFPATRTDRQTGLGHLRRIDQPRQAPYLETGREKVPEIPDRGHANELSVRAFIAYFQHFSLREALPVPVFRRRPGG